MAFCVYIHQPFSSGTLAKSISESSASREKTISIQIQQVSASSQHVHAAPPLPLHVWKQLVEHNTDYSSMTLRCAASNMLTHNTIITMIVAVAVLVIIEHTSQVFCGSYPIHVRPRSWIMYKPRFSLRTLVYDIRIRIRSTVPTYTSGHAAAEYKRAHRTAPDPT